MTDDFTTTKALGWIDAERMKKDYELVQTYLGMEKPFEVGTRVLDQDARSLDQDGREQGEEVRHSVGSSNRHCERSDESSVRQMSECGSNPSLGKPRMDCVRFALAIDGEVELTAASCRTS